MKKLKCWKKIRTTKMGEVVWRDDKKDVNVGIYANPHNPLGRIYDVDIDKGIGKVRTPIKKVSKEQALTFANKYMKKHNKC